MELFNLLGIISSIIGIVSGICAFSAWYQAKTLRMELADEKEQLHQKIEVKLRITDGSEEITLPVQLRRAELTRAELLGRIGMIPMAQKGARFSLAHLATPDFLQDINLVAMGKRNELIIPCSKEEMDQFRI